MVTSGQITKLVQKWAKFVGVRPAIGRLVARNISVATAEKLCTGRYEHNPRAGLSDLLLDEMAKDGFTLAGKAS